MLNAKRSSDNGVGSKPLGSMGPLSHPPLVTSASIGFFMPLKMAFLFNLALDFTWSLVKVAKDGRSTKTPDLGKSPINEKPFETSEAIDLSAWPHSFSFALKRTSY